MLRIAVIILLLAISALLFKYRSNEKVQKSVIYTSVAGVVIYVAYVMISELIR
ncbi:MULTISPECIES: hypothetical protein [unclassified Aliivibrio]|jgi:uncharacterized MnhB-related membrane protein|uniref:hypothetical protein n=1 Tax=unclassified Aliivibrio TaxID=2645654 RepID=UPI0011464EDA|nr:MULTISPECIES: hypothetical protein [unclassified Aliivibrio]